MKQVLMIAAGIAACCGAAAAGLFLYRKNHPGW